MPPALRLRGGAWELDVEPARGGRITSLRLDGVELLDQGIGVDQPSAIGFVEGGAWGWDELVPTVDASSWDGSELPDHGEAWRLPWTVVETMGDRCSMRCEGRALPWRLDRRLSLGDAVRGEYALTNIGEAPIPGYWCSHALFRYSDDMEVEVGAKLMRVEDGTSGKFFLPSGAVDRARLSWPSGPGVELSWDRLATPYCSVWICSGDLGGYRQVAIEPATGGGDRPDSDEPPPTLAPGESIEWWLEIRPAL
jgi:galactose mutarotase-like enzyme